MFTGLIEVVGTIRAAHDTAQGREFEIVSPWRDLAPGESIAVNGACLTVVAITSDAFTVQVVATSRERTAFADYAVGRRVHLERAMRLGDRLGGHLVQGHVDGVATVERVAQHGDTWVIDLAVPDEVAAVTIPLGSITVDGVSLTANAVPRRGVVQLAIIPFTLEHTTLGDLRPGDRVHVEGDLVGKYVRQQAAAWRAAAEG
jgi:riboflavin synthase